jgi:hypothetical protein
LTWGLLLLDLESVPIKTRYFPSVVQRLYFPSQSLPNQSTTTQTHHEVLRFHPCYHLLGCWFGNSVRFTPDALYDHILTMYSQNATAATSTIVIKPGCPSAAPADVMVTRSAVAVPTCEAGNATKPMIVSMSGYGMGGASPTGSGKPAQYTGAASSNQIGAMAIVGGVVAGLMF